MSLKTVAFWVGLFSLCMGLLTYDSEVSTAPIPIISGIVVMLLSVFGLIPDFTRCSSCNKKILKKTAQCPHCGAKQPPQDE